MKKLYVGNIPWSATEDEVKAHFETIGPVASVKIITDRDTGKSRGFCFVEMEMADEAIEKLHNTDMGGRTLTVNLAREREARPAGGSRGPSSGGYAREPRGYDNRRE